jgi:hypothetical protein
VKNFESVSDYFSNYFGLSDSRAKTVIGMRIAMGIYRCSIHKIGLPSMRTAKSQPKPSMSKLTSGFYNLCFLSFFFYLEHLMWSR